MNKPDYIQNLIDVTNQVRQAARHLEASFERCKKVNFKQTLSEENLIEFEALTSRFARLVDICLHKLFRSIDKVELIDGGTLIDAVNRAEKRGLIESALTVRRLKDLRNDIAHEYISERLALLNEEVFNAVPKLLEMIAKSLKYSEKYTSF